MVSFFPRKPEQRLTLHNAVIGNTVASVALTNELSKKLPQQFVDRLPAGIPSAFSAITELKDLPEPLKGQVKQAYSESFRTIWYVCIAFVSLSISIPITTSGLR